MFKNLLIFLALDFLLFYVKKACWELLKENIQSREKEKNVKIEIKYKKFRTESLNVCGKKYNMSVFMCQVSHVRCQVSPVTCHLSHVTNADSHSHGHSPY